MRKSKSHYVRSRVAAYRAAPLRQPNAIAKNTDRQTDDRARITVTRYGMTHKRAYAGAPMAELVPMSRYQRLRDDARRNGKPMPTLAECRRILRDMGL